VLLEHRVKEQEKKIRGGRRTAHQLLGRCTCDMGLEVAAVVGAVRAKHRHGGGALQTMEAEGKDRNSHDGVLWFFAHSQW